jgi:hypothetical protein
MGKFKQQQPGATPLEDRYQFSNSLYVRLRRNRRIFRI